MSPYAQRVYLCAVIWLGSSAVTAHAQPEAPAPPAQPAPATPSSSAASPENPQATQQARSHFRDGMAHFGDHQYREAIQEFELAASLVPSADLWFNIARSHEELSDYEKAIEYYQRYLRDRVDPPDREQVERLIASLEERAAAAREARLRRPTTGILRVTSNRAGAKIALDGRPIGQSPIQVPLSLRPGRYGLEVRDEGFVPFRSRVRVEAGVTTAAYADLVPATRYRTVRGTRVWTWVVGGLAVVALGASIWLGADAASRQNEGRLDDARDRARVSDYALGGALALGTGAAVLYLLEGQAVRSERITGPPRGEE